jgi:hypothetical protein
MVSILIPLVVKVAPLGAVYVPQAVAEILAVVAFFTVKAKLMILSQPAAFAFVNVCVYEPEVAYVCAFKVYGPQFVTERLLVLVQPPLGVTDAQVDPTRISSISALGVAVEFRIQIDANDVKVAVPELFVIVVAGSVPPKLVGFTHNDATVGLAERSNFTTTK